MYRNGFLIVHVVRMRTRTSNETAGCFVRVTGERCVRRGKMSMVERRWVLFWGEMKW